MYYISRDPNVGSYNIEKLYLLKDKNGNVVDQRWAINGHDAYNQFLRNNKELKENDLEFEVSP